MSSFEMPESPNRCVNMDSSVSPSCRARSTSPSGLTRSSLSTASSGASKVPNLVGHGSSRPHTRSGNGGSMAPPLSIPMNAVKEMLTNDPEGTSLTVRSNPKVLEASHCSSNVGSHGAAKSLGHDSSNLMDICQQRLSPVQCLERDVRARSPSKNLAFHGIPEDVYVNFIQFMSVQHLSKVSQVSRQLSRQCQCNSVWKKLCEQDFPPEDAPEIVNKYTLAFALVHDPNKPGFYQLIYRKMLDFRIEIQFLQGPRANDEPCKISKTNTTNIGRSRQNDICILQDEMVSRKHGKIIPHSRYFELEDLGSINGTFINAKQVTTNTTKQLRLGDEVEMGNSLFRIALVVPNPEDEDEATKTVTDDNEIAQLQKDYEMGDIAGADDGGDDVGDYQSEDENDVQEEEVEDPMQD